MATLSTAFSSYAVDDLAAAKDFYAGTLGLGVEEHEMGLLALKIQDAPDVMIYPKPDHTPATFTVLNFTVDDVEGTVDDLAAKGVRFQRYGHIEQDDRGISHGPGPRVAWFTDPAGNILSVMQES